MSFYSLTLLALLALSPFAEPWYALFGLIAAVIPGYLTGANVTYWLDALFGVSAIVGGPAGRPPGMPDNGANVFERLGRHRDEGHFGVGRPAAAGAAG